MARAILTATKDRGVYRYTTRTAGPLYAVRLTMHGRLWQRQGFQTKGAAVAFRDKVRAERFEGTFFPDKYRRRHLGERMEVLLTRHLPKKPSRWTALSEREKRRYWDQVKFATWWTAAVKGRPVSGLTADDLSTALQRLPTDGASTYNHYLKWLRTVLKREKVTPNVALMVPTKTPPQAPEFHYSPRQEAALYKQLGPEDADLVRLDLITAMRRQEIFSLHKDWIVWDHGHILLPDPKAGTPQFVHLTKEGIMILRRQCRRHPDSPWVYPSPRDPSRPRYPGSWYTKVFKPARDRARIPATHKFHTIRHTFPGRLAQEDVPDLTIKELGRWKQLQTVTRYTHHFRGHLRDSLEKAFPKPGTMSSARSRKSA